MPTSFQTQVAEATRSSPVGGNLFHQFAHRCAARTNILAIPIHGSPDFSGSPVSGVWVIWTHRPFGYPGPTHQRPTARVVLIPNCTRRRTVEHCPAQPNPHRGHCHDCL